MFYMSTFVHLYELPEMGSLSVKLRVKAELCLNVGLFRHMKHRFSKAGALRGRA
jgi:hypothetical protein